MAEYARVDLVRLYCRRCARDTDQEVEVVRVHYLSAHKVLLVESSCLHCALVGYQMPTSDEHAALVRGYVPAAA